MAGSERTAIRFEVVDQSSEPGRDCMSQDSSGDERLAHELELALRDPVQRQRLADYFAILQEWSLERQSAEPMSAQSPEVSIVSSGETARVPHPAIVQPVPAAQHLRAAVPGSANHPLWDATRRPTDPSTTADTFGADPHSSEIVHLRAYPNTWGGRRRGQYAAAGRNSRQRPLPRSVSAIETPIG